MRERVLQSGSVFAGALVLVAVVCSGSARAQDALADRIAQRRDAADQREQADASVQDSSQAPAEQPISVGQVQVDPATGRVIAGDPAAPVGEELVIPEPEPRAEELLPLGRVPEVAAGGDGDTGAAMPSLGGGWVLNTMAALGVVIGLILVLRWLAKRSGAVGAGVGTSVAVEVLARTTVAPRNHIVLLRVGPRILVVNDSGSGMRTLAHVEDPDEVAELLQSVQAQRQDSATRSFSGIMSRLSGSQNESDEAALGRDDREASVDHVRDTLSNLRGRLSALAGGGRGREG
ncbi:MAG: flagellar biosynthetic protein FliO [Planctomycetota bacterium]